MKGVKIDQILLPRSVSPIFDTTSSAATEMSSNCFFDNFGNRYYRFTRKGLRYDKYIVNNQDKSKISVRRANSVLQEHKGLIQSPRYGREDGLASNLSETCARDSSNIRYRRRHEHLHRCQYVHSDTDVYCENRYACHGRSSKSSTSYSNWRRKFSGIKASYGSTLPPINNNAFRDNMNYRSKKL